jgi:acetyltransferase-like isoleucine patch superfamily enzyme
MRKAARELLRAICLVAVFPFALACAFGRIDWLRELFAQAFAQTPGVPGAHLRVALYSFLLERCAPAVHIGYGSFFAHRASIVEPHVYVGAYCVLGQCHIGEGTHLASGVQLLSGRHQHARDGGKVGDGEFRRIRIGRNCWIGAGAIVMDDIGDGTTIGAGSVVTKPVPANAVYAGNPARDIRKTAPAPEEIRS